MTSLRFVLLVGSLAVVACSDDAKSEVPKADASTTDASTDAASDARETTVCPADAGMAVGCEVVGSRSAPSGVLEEVRWETCPEGKVYSIACSPAGSDGLSDCTCKVNDVASGTFRAVTPTDWFSKQWGELSACYCGVRP